MLQPIFRKEGVVSFFPFYFILFYFCTVTKLGLKSHAQLDVIFLSDVDVMGIEIVYRWKKLHYIYSTPPTG